MPKLRDWVRLPTKWIREQGLTHFQWNAATGSDHVAALMLLIAIAHHADEDTGLASLTYDALVRITGLSRPKISAGLDILEKLEILGRRPNGRSTYSLVGYDRHRAWGKLPARRLYDYYGRIAAFQEFHLRSRRE